MEELEWKEKEEKEKGAEVVETRALNHEEQRPCQY